MASSRKLVFISALLSSILSSIWAAPLRARRPRINDPPPAITPTPLTLQAESPNLSFDLTPLLPLPTSTTTTTPLDKVPANCAIYNSLSSECPTYFEVANVTYGDCGDAWTVCRCSTANMTMDTVVERLGRVPVGLRRYVATVVAVPGPETRAYTLTSGDVHMVGDVEVNSWVHESAHAFDWATGTPLSGTPEWQQAIDSDTCVPDTYAATSAGEDFAQITVVKIYSLLQPEGWNSTCMAHQMQYMTNLPIFNPDQLFGNTCAIAGSDPYSRHSLPPLTINPTRVQPAPAPAPPAAAAAASAPPANSSGVVSPPPPKDNAASSLLVVTHAKLKLAVPILIVGAVAGLLC